ncbi:Hsp33 protein, putative [Babesia ovata]|uniref:Hsp33 protein, putative n=1 Tax=Babesia ovata TaxID=189622 RepID=A0A2H6KBY4_9APIC|nr:Hsp33 protein, putative [Babesia ovata]GBE60497.1 Hsp33 protein, putative [Babesia ovata]
MKSRSSSSFDSHLAAESGVKGKDEKSMPCFFIRLWNLFNSDPKFITPALPSRAAAAADAFLRSNLRSAGDRTRSKPSSSTKSVDTDDVDCLLESENILVDSPKNTLDPKLVLNVALLTFLSGKRPPTTPPTL